MLLKSHADRILARHRVSFKSESHPKPTLAVGINPAHCSNRVIAVARLACRKICCAEWERPGDGSQQLPKSRLLLVPKTPAQRVL